MGLLDSLFDQSTYGGQGGGLLGLLRQSQMQQEQYQPSAGFPGAASPIDVGGYQMPRMGDQAQFTPPQQDPAALPSNAQPAQGQMPPQQAPEPGFGDRLMAGFQGFANAGGPLQALAAGVQGLANGNTPANQTAQFLASKGIDPAMARTIASDSGLLRSVLPSLLGTNGKTNHIKEFEYARQFDPTLTFPKFMQQQKSVNGELGLNLVYGQNDKGETVPMQPSKAGGLVPVQLPPGIKIAKGFEKIDAGTKWILRDKQTGAILGEEPKNVASKEAEEKVGQARGTAQAALNNGADLDAEKTMKQIDEFVSSKGFNEVFGQLDQYRPSWTHSNEGTDALARYKQLKGKAFLSAYAMLKGGGAITDIEGQKAGDAMARLDRAQSEDEAKVALQDFKDAVDMGLKKLRRAANGGAEPTAPTSTAAPKRIRLNADGTIAQ